MQDECVKWAASLTLPPQEKTDADITPVQRQNQCHTDTSVTSLGKEGVIVLNIGIYTINTLKTETA